MYDPVSIADVEQLELLLSEPTPLAVETMARLDGELIVLGVGGKMGPTLARMARRADELAGKKRRILGVSRFSSPGLQERLHGWGIETLSADLLDADAVASLPDAPNVIHMTGMKFGATGNESRTWAMNVFSPGMVAQKYRRSRIVAFSTGNVYGLCPLKRGGSREEDVPQPFGDYSISALGRERILEHFARTYAIPMAILRLNYATEMRYGVLVDVARKVYHGEPIDVSMGFLNALWQGDANAMSLCAFAHVSSPPFVVNLAGPEILSVRRVAEEFGTHFGKPAQCLRREAPDAFLSNGQLGHQRFGYPRVGPKQLMAWIADWVRRGGASLDKPTHFEVRDGKF